ncbi:MAG TPA: TrmH family RNA methyltransferase [Mycobacteriales bacterium]|nr:TrmH family RNA methyltransferase [Mycobacteriales bacterium]
MRRITTRNAAFQQWQALLSNRTKRQRAGEFLVQGVRPITLAAEHGWEIRTLLHAGGTRSRWAEDLLARYEHVALAPEMLQELGGKDEQELIAVVGLRADRLDRIAPRPDLLVVVFDRPTTPGNIGTLVRSADAFGAHGVIVTGHAADPYDPRAVRASTGSLFAIPVVRVPSHREVLEWSDARVVATDEHGDADLADVDLTGPTLVLIGNETNGLSAAWREAAQTTARIPITGAASSLNAATAGTVVLYEAARQRAVRPQTPGR